MSKPSQSYNPIVLMCPADTIKSASDALTAHLGKEGMLQAVGSNPGLLMKAGNKIHQTAAVVKGLLGDSEGTDLLKDKPRLLKASATLIEGNIQTLCDEFDRVYWFSRLCAFDQVCFMTGLLLRERSSLAI